MDESKNDIFSTFNKQEDPRQEIQKPKKKFGTAALVWTAIGSFVLGGLCIGGIVMVTQTIRYRGLSARNEGNFIIGVPTASGTQPSETEQPLIPGLDFDFTEPTVTPYLRTPSPVSETERPVPTFGNEEKILVDPNQADVAQVAERVRKSVVGVINYMTYTTKDEETGKEVENQMGTGRGSGVILSSDGYIVTNYHVISSGDKVMIALNEEEDEIPAEVIGTDAMKDIAILKIDRTVQPVEIGDSSTLKVGEKAIAVGNPMNVIGGSVTLGIISALDQSVYIESEGSSRTFIQTDAAINPGNSGGALVNASGELIGINTLKSVIAGYDSSGNIINAEGIGYAIPIDEVIPIAKSLIQRGRVDRPGIGVTVVAITEEMAEDSGIDQGILVTNVVKGGAADKAGILVDDLIIKVDNQTMETSQEMVDYVQSQPIGAVIEFTVKRVTNDAEEVKDWQWETISIKVITEDMNVMRSDEQTSQQGKTE